MGCRRWRGGIFVLLSSAAATVVAQHHPDESHLALAEAFQLDQFAIEPIALPWGLPAAFEVTIQILGQDLSLQLHAHSLRATDFRLRVQEADGTLSMVDAPPARTYRGNVLGEPGASVAASLSEGGLAAAVLRADGVLWHIQPAGLAAGGLDGEQGGVTQHVVYRDIDSTPGTWSCGTGPGEVVGSGDSGGDATSAGAGLLATRMAFDADHEYYLDNAGSVPDTVADIETVLNGAAVIYERRFGVTYQLAEIIVRTSEPDPYTSSNSGELLDEVAAQWNANHGDVDRQVTHLMTGKDLEENIVGRAFLGVICTNPPFAYGVTQSRYTSNLGLRTALTAHELGHNWNANHCGATGPACSGPWDDDCSIMCACIGLCTGNITSFGVPAAERIVGQIGQASCLQPGCIDLNGDGLVNSIDLTLLLSCLGESPDTCPYEGADVNSDGIINFTDLDLLLSIFGEACSSAP